MPLSRLGKRLLAALALAAASLPFAPLAADILGTRPGYLGEISRSFPNEQAVTPRIWAPGLDEGFTPQGLALVGKYVLVSAYQDGDFSRPPCRVFRIERETGAAAGYFDMASPCRHAGGIADLGGGFVALADTHQVWRIDLAKALEGHRGEDGARGMIKLGSGLIASFAFFDGKDLWNGVYTEQKKAADARIYRLDLGAFDRLDHRTLTPEGTPDVVHIPALAQGAALDRDGNLWISASSSQLGRLYRVDRKTGAVLARYDIVNGIEGLSFDENGMLWAVSEAGARKYMHWPRHYPVIFAIDVAHLVPQATAAKTP